MAKQALPGTRANMFLMDPADLTIIGIDTKDGPEHALYDERVHLPLDEALIKNLMSHGNKVPISVRKNGDIAEVVDGRQRVRCAREANKRLAASGKTPIRVKVIVERGGDGDMFGLLILTNELRQADGPLAKAEKLQRYLAMGYSEDEAAVTFGVTKQAIKNWLALLELDPTVRNAVEAGTLSASAAGKLASLPRDEQKASLKQLTAGGGKVTTERAKGAARARKNGASDAEPATPAPGKRQLRKIVERYNQRGVKDPNVEFIRGLRYALGELSPGAVRGLNALLFSSDDE